MNWLELCARENLAKHVDVEGTPVTREGAFWRGLVLGFEASKPGTTVTVEWLLSVAKQFQETEG